MKRTHMKDKDDLLYNSSINKGVTANKNMFNINVQTLSNKIYPLIMITISMLKSFLRVPLFQAK